MWEPRGPRGLEGRPRKQLKWGPRGYRGEDQGKTEEAT